MLKNGSPDEHLALRAQAAHWIREHPLEFEGRAEMINEYANNIMMPHFWGSDVEIRALSNALQLPVRRWTIPGGGGHYAHLLIQETFGGGYIDENNRPMEIWWQHGHFEPLQIFDINAHDGALRERNQLVIDGIWLED